MSEPSDPIDSYDAQHGRPEATPDMPSESPEELYGTRLNPVRETPVPFRGMDKAGA